MSTFKRLAQTIAKPDAVAPRNKAAERRQRKLARRCPAAVTNERMAELLRPLIAVDTIHDAGLEGVGDFLKAAYQGLVSFLKSKSVDLNQQEFSALLKRAKVFDDWLGKDVKRWAAERTFDWDRLTEREWEYLAEEELGLTLKGATQLFETMKQVPAALDHLYRVPHPTSVDKVPEYCQQLEQVLQPVLKAFGYRISENGKLTPTNGKEWPTWVFESAESWNQPLKGVAFLQKVGYTQETVAVLADKVATLPTMPVFQKYVSELSRLDRERTRRGGDENAAMRASVAVLYHLATDVVTNIYLRGLWNLTLDLRIFYDANFDGDEFDDEDDD